MAQRKIEYLPAIGIVRGEDGVDKADFFWSDEVRPLSAVDTIIIHSMFNPNVDPELQYLARSCRDLLNASNGASTNYYMGRQGRENGRIFRSVDDCRTAWHAGRSRMPEPDGRTGVSWFSYSIETIGNMKDGFTPQQYRGLAWLSGELMRRSPVRNVLGHSHIAGADVRPPNEIKTDPWNFDWYLYLSLLKKNIGERRYAKLALLGSQFE